MPIHKIRKTARAETEKLPDISGTMITYAGSTQCTIEVTGRDTAEPTVTAGAQGSYGGRSGVIEQMQTEILPQYKYNGSIVWETTVTMAQAGTSC